MAPLTASQMRALEQAAIASGAVSGLELMERAGQGVVEAIFEEWPTVFDGRDGRSSAGPAHSDETGAACQAVVLCGPGNNGGDGFVVARLLRARGFAVEAFLFGDPAALPHDARVNYASLAKSGAVQSWSGSAIQDAVDRLAGTPPLVIDALFGIGISRELPCEMQRMWGALSRFTIVAVDLPSGIGSDDGANFGALAADLTVTFHQEKIGHLTGAGPEFCGKVIVKDIGL